MLEQEFEYENFKEIHTRLCEIKDMGYASAMHLHDGSIGNTLEGLLGIKENNISLPDLGKIELKSKRRKSTSMLTLTSLQPLPRGVIKTLFKEYSHVASDNVRKLYTTIFANHTNPQGFSLKIDDKRLILINKHCIPAYWELDHLCAHITKKVSTVLLVYADKRGSRKQKNLSFYYNEAYLLEDITISSIKKCILEGKMKVDIRIGADVNGKSVGKYHDHGTAFRINENYFEDLFSKRKKVL